MGNLIVFEQKQTLTAIIIKGIRIYLPDFLGRPVRRQTNPSPKMEFFHESLYQTSLWRALAFRTRTTTSARFSHRITLGSLSNHDDDGNKNPTNLHIWQWKTRIFARFARALFIFWHFEDVLVLSTTWNDLFCSCVDDVSRWRQMFNFVFLCPKRWFQFNSRIVRTHFSSKMTLNNCEIIAETGSYIFRWRSRFRRRRVCLSSLLIARANQSHFGGKNVIPSSL